MKRKYIIIFCTIIAVIIVISIISIVGSKKDKWQGVYYPNGCLTCEDNYMFSPIFNSKQECLDWAVGKKILRNNEDDLYECGKNCNWKDGSMICEETVDE